jgi:hypothetical protein
MPCLLLPALVGCGVPRAPLSAVPHVLRQEWAFGDGEAHCAVVDDIETWRVERARLGPFGASLPSTWAAFAVERVVVLAMPGSHAAGPLRTAWHSEEGVDVLELTPAAGVPASDRMLLAVLVVPARRAQLVVVVRAPNGDGTFIERTLGVFEGR